MEVAMAAATLNVLDLGEVDAEEVTREDLQDMEQEEWSADLVQLADEIYIIKCLLSENDEPVNVGTTGPAEAEGDEKKRIDVIQNIVEV